MEACKCVLQPAANSRWRGLFTPLTMCQSISLFVLPEVCHCNRRSWNKAMLFSLLSAYLLKHRQISVGKLLDMIIRRWGTTVREEQHCFLLPAAECDRYARTSSHAFRCCCTCEGSCFEELLRVTWVCVDVPHLKVFKLMLLCLHL